MATRGWTGLPRPPCRTTSAPLTRGVASRHRRCAMCLVDVKRLAGRWYLHTLTGARGWVQRRSIHRIFRHPVQANIMDCRLRTFAPPEPSLLHPAAFPPRPKLPRAHVPCVFCFRARSLLAFPFARSLCTHPSLTRRPTIPPSPAFPPSLALLPAWAHASNVLDNRCTRPAVCDASALLGKVARRHPERLRHSPESYGASFSPS